jgi:hypothetical protein
LATCHPDRKHHAHGLCRPCADCQRRRGVTPQEYSERLAYQGGNCAVCGEPPREGERLVVDHDHASPTAEPRGLLHSSCNAAIGLLGDDPERVKGAIRYLEARRIDHYWRPVSAVAKAWFLAKFSKKKEK